MTHQTSDIKIKNRKVTFEYELIEKWIAGIKLAGTEIKSIRGGKVNLTESYCQFFGSELFVKNMHISEYDFGTCNNHEARRDRKLLLNRKELTKLEIALARGKKTYDKRESLKLKDSKRDMDRAMRN